MAELCSGIGDSDWPEDEEEEVMLRRRWVGVSHDVLCASNGNMDDVVYCGLVGVVYMASCCG